MNYIIVEFPTTKECEAVPSDWVSADKTVCWWLPYRRFIRMKKAIMDRARCQTTALGHGLILMLLALQVKFKYVFVIITCIVATIRVQDPRHCNFHL